MSSGASRTLGLLAVVLLVPACNLTITTDDPVAIPPPQDPFTLQVPLDGQTGVWPTNTQLAWGAYWSILAIALLRSRRRTCHSIRQPHRMGGRLDGRKRCRRRHVEFLHRSI